MSTIVTYSKNVLITLANRCSEGLLALILTSVIARKLGRGEVGIYHLIISIFMMFAIFSEFGSRLILIREVSKNKDKAPVFMASVMLLRGALTFICMFCLLFFVHLKWSSEYALFASYIYLFWLIPYAASEVMHGVFTGFEKNEYSAAASLPAKVFGCVIAIGILIAGGNLIPVFAILTLSACLRMILSFLILRRKLFKPKIFIEISNVVYIFRESLPLAIMSILVQLYNNAGLIILSFFWGDKEVGLLGVIAVVNTIFGNLALNLMMPLLPVLSRLREEDNERFQNAYRRFLKYLFGLTLPIGFGIFALGERIILLLYGNDYTIALPGLQIIVWSGVIFPFINYFAYLNTSVGLQRFNAKYSAYILFVVVLLNLILVPKFGYVGVCIANVAGGIFAVILYYHGLIKRSVVTFKIQDIPIREISAAVVMYFVILLPTGNTVTTSLFSLAFEIVWLTFLGTIVYFLLLFLTGAIDEYDRNSLKKIIAGLYEFFKTKAGNLRRS